MLQHSESSWLILGRPHSSHQHIYLIRRYKIYIKKFIHIYNVDSPTAITSWADTLLSPTSLSSAQSCMGSNNNYAFMSSWQSIIVNLQFYTKVVPKALTTDGDMVYTASIPHHRWSCFFCFPSYIVALSMLAHACRQTDRQTNRLSTSVYFAVSQMACCNNNK